MRNFYITLLLSTITILSCNTSNDKSISQEESWRLGWRMIDSYEKENYQLAEHQFDTLLNRNSDVDAVFIKFGLKTKIELGYNEEIQEILNQQSDKTRAKLCEETWVQNLMKCDFTEDRSELNEELQLELVKMLIDDQASRGNVLNELILKYNIDSTKIQRENAIEVDRLNCLRLKEIISEFGFPKGEQIGKDGMKSVFYIIQHSNILTWQKENLNNIEVAVKNGFLEGQNYAMFYDRIQMNGKGKQRYGTQLERIDEITYKFYEIEDRFNVDKQRMSVGLYPIEMYKRYYKDNLGITIVE